MNARSPLAWLLDQVSLGALYLYLVSFSVYYITDGIIALRVSQVLGLAVFGIETSRYLREYRVLYWILLVTVGMYLTKVILYGTGDLDVLVYLISGAGLAMVLFRLEPSRRVIWIIYGGFLAYFGGAMLQGVHPVFTMAERSYNHISVLGLAFGILLGILDVKRGRPVGFAAPVATFLLCLWAMGRSGILASGVFLLGVLWLRRSGITQQRFWLSAGAIALVGFVLVRSNAKTITEFLIQSTWKFSERGLVDPARSGILQTYLATLNGKTFLLGHEETIFDVLRLTLHNSYLLWHFYFGIGAILLGGITAVALWRSLHLFQAYALFLLVILLRSLTDTVLLPGPMFDVVFLFLITTSISGRTPAEEEQGSQAASEEDWAAGPVASVESAAV